MGRVNTKQAVLDAMNHVIQPWQLQAEFHPSQPNRILFASTYDGYFRVSYRDMIGVLLMR